MNEINELDVVALTCDLPQQGLKRSDVGAAGQTPPKGQSPETASPGTRRGGDAAVANLSNLPERRGSSAFP